MSASLSENSSMPPFQLERSETYFAVAVFGLFLLPALQFGFPFLGPETPEILVFLIWIAFFCALIELAKNTSRTEISVVAGTLIVDSRLLGIRDVVKHPPGTFDRLISGVWSVGKGGHRHTIMLCKKKGSRHLEIASFPVCGEADGLIRFTFMEHPHATELRQGLCKALDLTDEGFAGLANFDVFHPRQ